MFIIDCVSPLSQEILELKLSDYLATTNNYNFLITDRDIEGKNILIIGKDIHFPFSLRQVQNLIDKTKTRTKKETNATDKENNEKKKRIFKVEEVFEEEVVENLEAKMLLQIHDELIFEVPEDKANMLSAKFQNIMEDIFELNIPLKASLNIGKNWSELK